MVVVIGITTQLLKLKRAQPVCPWLAAAVAVLPATLLVNRLTSIITTIMAGYLYQMAPDLACSLGRNKATNWTLSTALCAIFGPKCTDDWHWLLKNRTEWTTFISWRGVIICIFLKLAISKIRRINFSFLFFQKMGFIRSAGKKLIYRFSGFKTIAAIFLSWCHLCGSARTFEINNLDTCV